MIDPGWLRVAPGTLLMIALSGVGIYATLILFTRLFGLRSFSKLSSFDFAITVGIGTVLASTLLTETPPLLHGVAALAALYGLQWVVATARHRVPFVARLVDNEPLLLMAGEHVLEENLARAHVSRGDLLAKLREANVIHPSQVRAVVLESTGDISVLHADGEGPALDLDLLEGVRGVERLRGGEPR